MESRLVTVVLCLAVILVPFGTKAEEDEASVFGIGVSNLLGVSICIPIGDADCEHIDSNFGYDLSAYFRFLDYAAIGFELYYGMYDTPAGGPDADLLGGMGLLRLIAPIGKLDLYAQLGLGGGRYKFTMEDDFELKVKGFNVTVGGGLEYRIIKWASLGVGIRFLIPVYDKICASAGDQSECKPIDDDADIAYGMLFGVTLNLFLPI